MWGDSESASKNTSIHDIEKFSELLYKKFGKIWASDLAKLPMTTAEIILSVKSLSERYFPFIIWYSGNGIAPCHSHTHYSRECSASSTIKLKPLHAEWHWLVQCFKMSKIRVLDHLTPLRKRASLMTSKATMSVKQFFVIIMSDKAQKVMKQKNTIDYVK